MSRLLARDGLKDGEIRLYVDENVHECGSEATWERSAEVVRHVEFESLDWVALGPYLLLLAAQDRAEELIAAAARDAEQSRQEARRQGAEQGRADSKDDILPALVAFADAGQSLIVFEEQLIARCTPQIVRLALEIAEKVIGKAVAEDRAIIDSVLERAERQVIEARQIRVRLHPADFKFLAETRPDIIRRGENDGRVIEILPSEEISRGGCRLETEIGVVDATIPTQLEEIRRQLLDDGSQAGAIPGIETKSEFLQTTFEER